MTWTKEWGIEGLSHALNMTGHTETGLSSLVFLTIKHHGSMILPLRRTGRGESISPFSPASLRLRQRLLYIPLEKQWDWEFSFRTQQHSVLRNPPDQLHLVNNERGSRKRILKALLPPRIPGEAWERVSFCTATFCCSLAHFSSEFCMLSVFLGFWVSNCLRMKEKFTHDLFCVLILFPRHLPSKPKGLGKVFRERKNNEFPKYLTEMMKGECGGNEC